MQNNKEILTVSLKLFIITACAAFCLAFVNKVTSPVIAENQRITMENTQKEVLSDATSFKQVDFSAEKSENGTYVKSINKGLNGDKIVGYTVTAVSERGYGGNIEIMIGYTPDIKITKVKITETSETAGLGLKASEPSFIDQFSGRDAALKVIKNSAPTTEGENIAAISGATVTSSAVTNAVNKATEVLKEKAEASQDKAENTDAIKNEISKETERQIKEGN